MNNSSEKNKSQKIALLSLLLPQIKHDSYSLLKEIWDGDWRKLKSQVLEYKKDRLKVESPSLPLINEGIAEQSLSANKIRALNSLSKVLAPLIQVEDKIKRLEDLIDGNEIQLLDPEHKSYPQLLKEIANPPVALTVKGHFVWANDERPGLSVVGSREPCMDNIRWLETEFFSVLSDSNIFTVSGGARGVDQAVHRMSLLSQTPTVAIFPSGLLNIYPGQFKKLAQSIVDNGGAIMSEFAPETPMKRFHFERRNRLIAGLTEKTLVVEARAASGSMLTATHALNSYRDVMALPGLPTDARFRGNLKLLKDGAIMIVDQNDLLSQF